MVPEAASCAHQARCIRATQRGALWGGARGACRQVWEGSRSGYRPFLSRSRESGSPCRRPPLRLALTGVCAIPRQNFHFHLVPSTTSSPRDSVTRAQVEPSVGGELVRRTSDSQRSAMPGAGGISTYTRSRSPAHQLVARSVVPLRMGIGVNLDDSSSPIHPSSQQAHRARRPNLFSQQIDLSTTKYPVPPRGRGDMSHAASPALGPKAERGRQAPLLMLFPLPVSALVLVVPSL